MDDKREVLKSLYSLYEEESNGNWNDMYSDLMNDLKKFLNTVNINLQGYGSYVFWSFKLNQLFPYKFIWLGNDNVDNKEDYINRLVENGRNLLKEFSLTSFIMENNKDIDVIFCYNNSFQSENINGKIIINIKENINEEEINNIIEEFKSKGLSNFNKSLIDNSKDNFEKLLTKLYILQLKATETNYIWVFPIRILEEIRGTFFLFTSEIPNDNENTKNIVRRAIVSIFHEITIYELKILEEEYSLRSAVAAIMARNMSHNIGSHVLNYLSNPEELDNLWVI